MSAAIHDAAREAWRLRMAEIVKEVEDMPDDDEDAILEDLEPEEDEYGNRIIYPCRCNNCMECLGLTNRDFFY